MENLYIYIENNMLENVVKYGIKLSEFSNKILNISNDQKKSGIIAYLTPKDSELYYDSNYTCIRILAKDINYIIYNRLCENTEFFYDFISNPEDYNLGDYEEPIALIYSTILPENISIYNKLMDIPILIENSKEYYYEKAVNDMLEYEKFTKYELYQMLLILGNQKKIFDIIYNENGIRIYNDKKDNKFYTKKGNT